ncbi:SE1561 family protein [Alkalicoccobacillus plakortidis]|uniref:SE1561 family protein n=1 Tax=Alkalicoccobacillus plakortidis TaxID=444060 RepID=A0ABT0XLS4_9BACI|nr:SE1561 family protein [Alkalicoccobacillus plakortidis]MCM2676777.1 SE1561 family protein [Alkalicoccobacillus plakortidis]
MGGAIHDKEQHLSYLKNRLQLLITSLDSMDSETAEPADLERFLQMINQIEIKAVQFKKEWEREGEGN